MKKLSLRYRILLPITALIIIGMATSATISSQGTSKIVRSNLQEYLGLLTQNIATEFGQWFDSQKNNLLALGEENIYREILNTEGNKSKLQLANKELASFLELHEDLDNIILYDTKGRALASGSTPIGTVDGARTANNSWFAQALRGEVGISHVRKKQSTGATLFSMAIPVKDNQRITGVLYATISLQQFAAKIIAPIKIGEQGYLYMTDPSGLVTAHPNQETILSTNLNDYSWGKEIIKQQNGSDIYTFNNLEKLVVYHTDPVTGWVIAAGAATEDIFGPLHQLQFNNSIVTIVIVMLLILVIILLVKPIVTAIGKGVDFAKEIQQGDLSNRLQLIRGDEIGHLATALDSMADSLQQRAALAEAIAQGDLTCEVELASERDQLGRSLQTMSNRLNEVMAQISMASEQIDSGSEQVSTASQELSHGSTEQASSVEEISASLNELAGRTRVNANNAANANKLAAEAKIAASNGSTQMQQMVKAMQEINESGQSISKIIKTIDEIAFQTNLLALNAAVEAARAGQHGKGFAVVAEEVRNLAARSAKAAHETAALIEGSVLKGENGSDIAARTAAALEEIVTGIGQTADLVADIAASSEGQASGISEVNDGLTLISEVTQRNTAGAEESAAAAEELSSQSTYLHQLVAKFQLKDFQLESNRGFQPQLELDPTAS
jgi:methyl-accepting chemotaxis protein